LRVDDIGISPHAVDQHSDWLVAVSSLGCHIKFS